MSYGVRSGWRQPPSRHLAAAYNANVMRIKVSSSVVGSGGYREVAALAALIPGCRPTGAGQAPVSVGLLHFRLAHGPTVVADTFKMFRLQPECFLAPDGSGTPQRQKQD